MSFITFHTHALHGFCIEEKFTRYQHTSYALEKSSWKKKKEKKNSKCASNENN